tara:strand:+ start:69 stop:746 length:678 start_codon:yes stop_codon:yes gene_type:complete
MKTICYIRRSTAKQALSVERQKDQLMEYAKANDIVISDWKIEEPISGKSSLADRPALNEAIFSLNRGDQLLALNVSRVARDEIVFYSVIQALNQRRAELVLADGSKGNLMIGLMVIFAAAERQAISARTKQALKIARSKGRALGRPDRVRYGYFNDSGWLRKCPEEQAVIAEVKRLRKSGYSYSKIAAQLEAVGYTTRKGTNFCQVAIGRIVRRENDDLPVKTLV